MLHPKNKNYMITAYSQKEDFGKLKAYTDKYLKFLLKEIEC